jgi:hypothetical protein
VSITATPGVGIGAAMVGLRPVVEITMVNLVMLALDQIVSRRGAPCLLPKRELSALAVASAGSSATSIP